LPQRAPVLARVFRFASVIGSLWHEWSGAV
jgi:hypothetical protein